MKGHILVSMPHMTDPYFGKAIVLICDHDKNGAMGLIVNKTFDDKSVKKVFPEIIVSDSEISEVISPIYFGGPVSLERGFFLHSTDFSTKDTMAISDEFALTSNIKVVEAIRAGKGPEKFKMMLGYAGWGAKQLEKEIEQGDWLFQETSQDFVFEGSDSDKWLKIMRNFGLSGAPTEGGLA